MIHAVVIPDWTIMLMRDEERCGMLTYTTYCKRCRLSVYLSTERKGHHPFLMLLFLQTPSPPCLESLNVIESETWITVFYAAYNFCQNLGPFCTGKQLGIGGSGRECIAFPGHALSAL